MATIADLLVHIGVDASDLEAGMDSVAERIDDNFGKITAAGAIAGAGMEGFARKMAEPNEAVRRLAARTGLGEDAMRDLAKETSNVTFPMGEVLALMETGAQRGLEGADALQEFATFWDTVGDATGENSVALGEASAALQAVGIDAASQEDALDALGFITDNTTGSVGEFLNFLDRTGPQLRDMGANVDDAAAIMGALESELGMTGRTARSEFRKAVNEADGDMGEMLKTLGLSEDQFQKYRGAVEGSASVIERNAAIHADSFTPMQKLSHAAEETMLKYGGLASMAGSLAMPMMALGPISKGVSLGLQGISSMGPMVMGAFSKVGGAFTALSKLLMANPWILLIAATIALVVLIVKNWDKILDFLKKAWDWIKDTAAAVGQWFKDKFKEAVEFVKTIFLNFTGPGLLIKHWDAIKEGIANVVGFFREKWDAVVDFFKEIPGKIGDAAKGMWDGIKDAFRSVLNWIIDKWNALRFNIPSIDTPFGTLGGGSIGVPRIPRLHDGTDFFRPPGGGREGLALLERGEQVIPKGGSTAGTSITIGNVYGWDDFVAKVREAGVDINRLGLHT